LAQIFSKKVDKLLPIAVATKVVAVFVLIGLVWYYFSPRYTDVGYRPEQPIHYSHKLHAGDLGIDCRYCHTGVETQRNAGIPPIQVCMNCHSMIGKDNPNLAPLRDAWATGKPVQWVRVNDLPDFAYFNHAAHIRAQVGCESCHGNITQMEVVMRAQPLSMSWCLDCHRNPIPNIRPANLITKFGWTPSKEDLANAEKIILAKNLRPSEDCSTCHR
jgi:hypothetical protein